jgi:hypothetical protein
VFYLSFREIIAHDRAPKSMPGYTDEGAYDRGRNPKLQDVRHIFHGREAKGGGDSEHYPVHGLIKVNAPVGVDPYGKELHRFFNETDPEQEVQECEEKVTCVWLGIGKLYHSCDKGGGTPQQKRPQQELGGFVFVLVRMVKVP